MGLEIAARDGDPENYRRDCLADRLHGVQVRASVVGMPGGIEIVVSPSQPGIQRAFDFCFFPVDARIIVGVLALEDFLAAAKDLETIDKRVLSGGEIRIQIRQSRSIEPHPGRCPLVPALGGPGYRGATCGVTDADAR